MKYKVTAKHYVEASCWEEAERRVEQGLVEPDQIDSEPANRSPKDIATFAISSKIHKEHRTIFFEDELHDTYDHKLFLLRKETLIWLESMLDEIINTNEQDWV